MLKRTVFFFFLRAIGGRETGSPLLWPLKPIPGVNGKMIIIHVSCSFPKGPTNRFTWVNWWRARTVRGYSATATRKNACCSHPTTRDCTRATWRATTRSGSTKYRTATRRSYPSRSRTAAWCLSYRTRITPRRQSTWSRPTRSRPSYARYLLYIIRYTCIM